MQSDPSGATAEGMSTVSAAPAENPALLALLPEIKKAWQTFTIAECNYRRARKAGRELWPRAPRIIKEERLTSGGDIERDIEGAGFGGGGYISTTAFVARALDAHRGVKGMAAKRRALEAEMAAARDYETACEAARTVSGFSAARAERVAAIKGLEALVRQAASENAHTMEGVKVKAEAIMLWDDVPFVFRVDEMMNGNSSLNLAASILDILEPIA